MIGSTQVQQKKLNVISLLREHRAIVVALSGGVDSATLLALACEAVGSQRVLAVTGRSASVAEEEIDDARRVSQSLRVRHEIVETREIDRPGYRANAGDRCLHCRSELFELLTQLAHARGIQTVVYGAIADDLAEDRPGMAAASALGVLAPLLDAGFKKDEVRTLAKEMNLHIHNKPANACLASRIPIGHEVTPKRLEQVGTAERALHALGFRQLRVRHHDEVARLELGDGEAARLTERALRDAVVSAVKGAGFRFVAVDLEPYRAGRLMPQHQHRLHSIGPARDSGQ